MRPADVAAVLSAIIKTKRAIPGKPERRDATRTSARASGRGGSCECENFFGATFAPPTPLSLPQPSSNGGHTVGVAPLPVGGGQFRLLADEEASGGSRCHGNRRKASPGIVRNNYPALNSARSRALRIFLFLSFPLFLSFLLSATRQLANRLRG